MIKNRRAVEKPSLTGIAEDMPTLAELRESSKVHAVPVCLIQKDKEIFAHWKIY
jgi:hypothetical protein